MTRRPFPTVLIGLGVAALAAGCGKRLAPPANMTAVIKKQIEKEAEKAKAPVTVQATGNSFTIDDAQGRRLLEAKVHKLDGTVDLEKGLQVPIKLQQAKCRLFRGGKPQMDLESPTAIWDGKQLIADKSAHAVTSDKQTIIDSGKAVWTADTGHLALDNAKLQAKRQGKLDFTAEGPKALVAEQLVTMPAGGAGRNPEGQQLTADHVRWRMDTGKLEADGNVVILDAGTRITGERLKADTKLKKGRLTGGTRIQLKKTPLKNNG